MINLSVFLFELQRPPHCAAEADLPVFDMKIRHLCLGRGNYLACFAQWSGPRQFVALLSFNEKGQKVRHCTILQEHYSSREGQPVSPQF